MFRKAGFVVTALLLFSALGVGAYRAVTVRMGKQPDGSFIVSTGGRVEPGAIAFDGRPIDIALHPSGDFFAVLDQQSVFLANRDGVIADSSVPLADGASYRGALWSKDGTRLFVSISEGYIQELKLDGQKLTTGSKIQVKPDGATGNPRPGGMTMTQDGTRLFVADCDRSAVAEIDLATNKFVKEYPVQNLPFEVNLSPDEKTLIVSNWGGRIPDKDDRQAASGNAMIDVDERGSPSSGTVSLVERETGKSQNLTVGIHPTGIAVDGDTAYVANAASDSISVIDVPTAKVIRTFPLKWGDLNLFGSMPCALTLRDKTLYACNLGDNALCEISLPDGKVRGFRPAGYFPTGVALSQDGKTAFVVNTQGNGSVRRTSKGQIGNAHDFQGTVSVIDLAGDIAAATEKVAADNNWRNSRAARPNLAVYHGAIKHVLYIIKENRTYDEIFGDMPEGNGDPRLCTLGAKVMPNHQALARAFTLFDNAYVCGTNSAEGHAWCNQGVANDYLQHFYAGYRTYPDDGDCAMSISAGGDLWDMAIKKHKSFRDYGEFCDDELAKFTPMPDSWLDMWKDRANGTHKYKVQVGTRVASLRKFIHPQVVYWPLLQSDQARADLFNAEYQRFSREDRVPDLMILSLPCDHSEGMNPKYPKPQSMMADNDLALGRVVEAVSHSPQWKDTCIFVIEDDAQSGPDHVDGHRTSVLTLSPYTRRHFVDSSLLTTDSILRSIELMLGLDPMTRFDALSVPFTACFTDTPDLTPYNHVPNNIPLDDMNTPTAELKGKARTWAQRSAKLDWSGPDHADPLVLNQIIWHSIRGVDVPYSTGR